MLVLKINVDLIELVVKEQWQFLQNTKVSTVLSDFTLQFLMFGWYKEPGKYGKPQKTKKQLFVCIFEKISYVSDSLWSEIKYVLYFRSRYFFYYTKHLLGYCLQICIAEFLWSFLVPYKFPFPFDWLDVIWGMYLIFLISVCPLSDSERRFSNSVVKASEIVCCK